MDLERRTAREVLDDHLQLANAWEFERDLARNFSKDIVLLTGYGIFRGLEGVRAKVRLLAEHLPGGRWVYRTVMAEGEIDFWNGAPRRTTAPAWRTAPIPISSALAASGR